MMVLFVWLAIALVFILEMVLVCAVAVAMAVFGMTIYDAFARSGVHYVDAMILVFMAPFLGVIIRILIENTGLWPWPWSKSYPLHHLFWGLTRSPGCGIMKVIPPRFLSPALSNSSVLIFPPL